MNVDDELDVVATSADFRAVWPVLDETLTLVDAIDLAHEKLPDLLFEQAALIAGPERWQIITQDDGRLFLVLNVRVVPWRDPIIRRRDVGAMPAPWRKVLTP